MSQENYVEQKPRHGLFIPLVLIVVGIVFFVTTLGILHQSAWDVFAKWWPLLMVIAGIDQLYQRSGSVGAMLVIGLGGLFLLGNLGLLNISAWNIILRMWPVFIVAWGLDLLIGNKTNFSMVLGVVLGFLIFLGVVWFTMSAPFAQQKSLPQTINYEKGAATKLAVNIDSVYGDLSIAANADPAILATGSIRTAENQKLENELVLNGSEAMLNLKNAGNFIYPVMPFGASETLSWDLGLNSGMPLALNSRTILGKQSLDLTLLQLESLQAETVMGQTIIALPLHGNFKADINTVMGDLLILVPKGAAVEIERNTFATAISLPEDFVKADNVYHSPAFNGAVQVMHLVIDQPIGRLVVKYAE